MSIKVMTAVWEHSQHKGGDLLLLLALADFAHDDGTHIYPSVDTMKRKVRLSRRAVQYILARLLGSGELVEDGRLPNGTIRYRVDIDALGDAKSAHAKVAPLQNSALGDAKSDTLGVQPIASKSSPNHQESPEEMTDKTFMFYAGAGLPADVRLELKRAHTRRGALDRAGYAAAARARRQG